LLLNRWLNDSVLETYGLCLFSNEYKFEKCDAAYGFINENGNHWILMFIDANKFYLIDPKKNYKILDKHGNTTFKQSNFFCKKFPFLKKRKWKLALPEHSYRIDSSNCGVFVCEILSRLIEENDLIFGNDNDSLERKSFLRSFINLIIIITNYNMDSFYKEVSKVIDCLFLMPNMKKNQGKLKIFILLINKQHI
ncbi:hypothetical protein BpHYR1_017450, partial [Brachionus plicatilis]